MHGEDFPFVKIGQGEDNHQECKHMFCVSANIKHNHGGLDVIIEFGAMEFSDCRFFEL